MKQQKEFYAIARNGSNRYLMGYENNKLALTFTSHYTDDIRAAAIFEKGDEKSEKAIRLIAEAVNGRLIKVKAEYEITEEDGSDMKQPEEFKKDEKVEALLEDLFSRFS